MLPNLIMILEKLCLYHYFKVFYKLNCIVTI